jgi:very-short-patch-repair endonuclease
MNKCPHCNYQPKNERSYKIHLSKSHPNEYKQYEQELKQSTTQDYEFYCKICGPHTRFKTYKGLQAHSSHEHKISGKELYMLHNNITEVPKCKCGCGAEVKFFGGNGGWFGDFVRGHSVRLKGGFYTKKGLEKSAKTRKAQFESGERVQWNKGKQYTEEQYTKLLKSWQSPERCKKISESHTGKVLSPEHVAKITEDRKKYWGNPVHREEQRERRMQYILNNGLGHSSKLEDDFAQILDMLEMQYIKQFYVREIKGIYDFKIKGKNILIEVDGDYWHCNPNIDKCKTPTQQWHFDNLERDKRKNEWAELNGYTLLRFWEHDINNNRLEVIQKLIKNLK